MSGQEPISSPVATGGTGTFFEQHVDALFLALLLVRGIPPVLRDCQVEEVHLQTERLGWSTDDLLIVGTRGVGRRQLAAQIKLRFTISSKNEECQKAFSDFWSDFKSNDRFDPNQDRLALVTLRGTDTLLDAFNSLLDCARASASAADFGNRLATAGYLSKTARDHATAIKTIVAEKQGEAPSDDDYWLFFRMLHVVSLDLNTATGQNEVWIKTLLAQTSHASDPVAAAEATWRELLEIAGAGMPSAVSYTYSSLPESLRNRHAAVAAGDGGALQALAAHSETTLQGIQTTIAHSARISRDALVTRALELLNESQVVVVTGPAGSGKSALARNAIELLGTELFCLTFRAEEFAASHIDDTLQRAQASVNAKRLLALLAAQARKVFLVESVERLLEAPVRDAFSDLLRLAERDRSIQLVLTCRDYSLETVRTSLLDQATLPHSVLEVPPLTDDELAHVVRALPALARPMTNASLKELLRSPYLLDKAARMDWSGAVVLPSDERAFRLKCWSEVVRRDAVASAGLPRRREHVFLQLALLRAQALSPYVRCDDLDAQAVDELRKDDLVVVSKETSALAAPAHDVLEDWAIIQWLDGQFSLREGEARTLTDDIGGYPAIRRGYRKWLGEMLECETERADAFVLASFKDESLPGYFRDDTLVSTLLSSSARGFLTRQSEALLADQARLLVRVIHLLRVACKTTPRWLRRGGVPSQLLVPHGEAWPAALEIASAALDRLLPANLGLLLGLLEDWVRAVEWARPEPPGFHEAGRIVFALLTNLDGYRMDDLRKRALKVIAIIPRADAAAFKDLLRRGRTLDRQDHAAAELAEILLTGLNGGFACRDFPEEMVTLATARFCLSDEDLRDDQGYHSSIEIEPFFGIRDHTHTDFFPASAIRGPYLPLLQYHPRIGVKFITDLLNHAGTWYGEQRWPYDRLGSPWRLTIDIPGEGQITQWANARLWCLYRGISVGPYVLQSALMALESWLLDICQIADVDVEAWLLKLLRDSNNVAITAVVASVCNAHPAKGGRAALALLTSRELIEKDRARMVQDRGQLLPFDVLPTYDAETRIYNEERKKSDALPHRRHDVEALAVKLQLGGQRDEVWQILDRHRAALPPVEEQSEEHRLWRLALHRMDVRGYRPIEPQPRMTRSEAGAQEDSTERSGVYYAPGAIEQDIQEVVDQHATLQAGVEADLALLNWGRSAWEGNQTDRNDPSAWKAKLVEAQQRDREPREAEDFSRGGPGFIAAVYVRDHWEEMEPQDREWCLGKLISELERDCDTDDDSIRHARGLLHPDRSAAYVLPRVLSEGAPQSGDARLVGAIAKALTHSVSEVVAYAAEGIGYYLQGTWRDFALRCVGALARQARLIKELQTAQKSRRFNEQLRADELARKVATDVRKCIVGGELDAERELTQLDLKGWPGSAATRLILQIFGYWTDSTRAREFYGSVARFLVESWNEERRDRRKTHSRDHHFEYECSQRIARFVLKLQPDDALVVCEPVLAKVSRDPREIAKFVRDLIAEADRSGKATPFWQIWQAFADRICAAPWIASLDSRYIMGTELLRAIFLGVEWKEGVRHWRLLEGQSDRIDALVEKLPAATTVVSAYCRFLYEIGERSLPHGFVVVAGRLKAGNPSEILAGDNTTFCLESLLGRYVYGEPLRLKSNGELRRAVLHILDELVETGSSAAFRMRDDFVTPIGKQL